MSLMGEGGLRGIGDGKHGEKFTRCSSEVAESPFWDKVFTEITPSSP